MNRQSIEGKWGELKSKAKSRWTELAHEAEKQLDELLAKLDHRLSQKKEPPQAATESQGKTGSPGQSPSPPS